MRRESIAENLRNVRRGIAQAAESCGRNPSGIQLLAVSKTFPAEDVAFALDAGQFQFGENKIQEGQQKIPALALLGGAGRKPEWHLIGHLQSNKAAPAVELFDLIETLDSPRLAAKLEHQAAKRDKRQRVLIQINVGNEEQKSGIEADQAIDFAREVESADSLLLEGLMAIPPWDEDPERSRPHFRSMKRLFDEVCSALGRPLPTLSMGMSHDFAVAIEEGSTLVRVGTAIFGRRVRQVR